MVRAFVVVNVLAALAFAAFAALQANDPDPWLWIPIYALPAAMCLLAAAGRLPRGPSSLMSALAVVAALPLLPAAVQADPDAVLTDLAMYGQGVEEAREVLGLAIVAVWMGFLGAARASARNRFRV